MNYSLTVTDDGELELQTSEVEQANSTEAFLVAVFLRATTEEGFLDEMLDWLRDNNDLINQETTH